MTSRRRMMMAEVILKPRTKGVVNGIIQDSVAQVICNCQADKAKDYYSIGDRLVIPLEGFGDVEFDYLGSGLEVRSDGTSKPISTWLSRDIIAVYRWSSGNTTTGGWELSDLRNYCRTTIYSALPKKLRKAIIEVNKVSNNVTTKDTVWIPSGEEVTLKYGLYKDRFLDRNSLIKSGAHANWWLRSYTNEAKASCIQFQGYQYAFIPTDLLGVVPGFCI